VSLVKSEIDGGVALLKLCNPKANTYSYEMMRELDAAILDARMNDAVSVIVLTGDGDKFFCAGADIAMLQKASPDYKYYFCIHANETLNRLEQTAKLTIAAINGHCVGGGLEVAMACDLRVARKDAGKCGLPEVKLGVLPGTGGTQRLVRMVGKSTAIRLMAEGELFGFDRALELGIVDRVVDAPPPAFMAEVAAYARSFCAPGRAPRAVGRIKRACQSGSEMSFEQGLALERELQQQLFTGEDAKEGIAANLDRRDPAFKGR
jgi:enoyl-CoA hydratase/carnithine racemase